MNPDGKVNILLVDDQPAKLLSCETILQELNENLVKASSAREALEFLLKAEFAVVLVDVCMPELDGFELAAMIRDHPRFKKIAIIFISAIHLADVDHLRGYEMGAVDYVSVPVIPQVLRAKVRVFTELYRKTRQLEQLNQELERRVTERTAALETSNARLLRSEESRSLALAAGRMGSWDLDLIGGECTWDEGQHQIFGVDPADFQVTAENVGALIDPEDRERLYRALMELSEDVRTYQTEFRVRRPNGETRWCIGAVAGTFDASHRLARISGVTVDITRRKEAEERQALLAREVDHRARNALAVTQSIVRLTRAKTMEEYNLIVQGRIAALARTHTLLSQARWQGADLATIVRDEMAPYRVEGGQRVVVDGPSVSLPPAIAQSLGLALHELATNAAKYGALSTPEGNLALHWDVADGMLRLKWIETNGPPIAGPPASKGFGTKIIESTIKSQFGGRSEFEWQVQGLRCTLMVPFGPKVEILAASSLKAKKPEGQRKGLTGNRMLLVEDDAMVAEMMRDMLVDLGYSVTGPYARVADAAAIMKSVYFDAAVLDINLNGEMVYPLADLLYAGGVPFVFTTGYGPESIEPRFAHVPVLQKPIGREELKEAFCIVRAAEANVN